ncbi:MAG: DUF2075 domain-containing protein [Sulfurovum sp.]|nr:DUF2075 domain-containing protein [Sulfurovum sp.]
MKIINILSLVQAKDSLELENYKNFLVHYGIEIKDDEIQDLKSFIDVLNDRNGIQIIFNQFYVGFKIPQVAKEFDLLRFGEESIINIELKRSSTEDKIKKQLKQNRYYLKFINKKVYNYTFVSDTKKIYCLKDDDTLEEVEFVVLAKLLYEQKIKSIENIEKLFNPSDYLVSPFNSTEKFIENKYFLTQQQISAKSKIINTLKDMTKANFFSVTGSAGTGKTLLTYDIAKEIISNEKRVLIIHCGCLNNGHIKLNTTYNWKIIEIKSYNNYSLSDYDLIIVDEAQRMRTNQVEDIVSKIKNINGNCIFSYDRVQTLATWEENNNIGQKIDNIDSIIPHKLSEKIRTNKEIALFIKRLFNKNNNDRLEKQGNVVLNYFKNDNDVREYLENIDSSAWKIIRYTPSQRTQELHGQYSLLTSETSHKVIGQEFDNVVVVIDRCFFYNENGKLQYKCQSYYHPVKMLFQNLTRARKKLNIVIVDNSEVLERCLAILK